MLQAIAAQEHRLDALRPPAQGALLALQKTRDVDLTYTSNAIKGNTLPLREPAEVIDHGITVGGKRLCDHLKAAGHYNAVLFMTDLASSGAAVGEAAVRELHRRIVFRSQPEMGGAYSLLPRRIAGSAVVFPNPLNIPVLMAEFGTWLGTATLVPAFSFEAHFRLAAIHPFSDGHG